MTKSVDYYKLLIILPCTIILLLFLLFFFGLSKVDAAYLELNVTKINAQYYGSSVNLIGNIAVNNSNGYNYFTQDIIPPSSPNLSDLNQIGTIFYTISFDSINIKSNTHNSIVISYSSNWGLEPSEFLVGSRSYSTSCSVQNESFDNSKMYYYTCSLEFDWLFTSFDLSSIRIYFNQSGNTDNAPFVHFGVRGRMYYYNLNNTTESIDSFKQQSHDDNLALQEHNKKIAEEQKKRDEEMQKKQDETNDKLDEQNKTSKNIFQKIVELPETITNLFLNMLKSLFIPSEDDLNDIINKSTELSENFGFVGESFSFVIRLFTSIAGMVNGDGCLILPKLHLQFNGILNMEDYVMWEQHNVCMVDNPWFGKDTEAIDIVRTLTTGSLVCAFISFAVSQLNKILSKEDTET